MSVPEQYYQTNPQQYSVKPVQAWAWQCQVYALSEKLMAVRARSVALDVVFAGQSAYGETDDRA